MLEWERMTVERPAPVIFLTGLSGSGKSVIGSSLGRRLRIELFDTDEMIARSEHMSVRAIFDRHGESYFRRRERVTITEFCADLHRSGRRAIVSLGGGSLMNAAVAKQVMKTGVLIYLKISCSEAARRMLQSDTRPLILDEDGQRMTQTGLTKRLRQLLSQRRAGFERAHFTISVTGRSPSYICESIIKLLAKKL